MTKRAILSVASEQYAEVLDIGAASMCEYADRWGYDAYLSPGLPRIEGRGDSWNKLPAAMGLLATYDEVLILDADTIIAKPEVEFPWEDIYAKKANHAIVVERTDEGMIPSTGVWGLTWRAMPMLADIWAWPNRHNNQWADQQWMEQSAYMAVMGYDQSVRPVVALDPIFLEAKGCYQLDPLWNVTNHNTALLPDAIIKHATGPGAEKIRTLQGWKRDLLG